MEKLKKTIKNGKVINAVDLFCGVGGLTHGLIKAGIKVSAGYDIDKGCKYAFEANNNSNFYSKDVAKLTVEEVKDKLNIEESYSVLAGCAPCQPFSAHSHKIKNKEDDNRWYLLRSFIDLIKAVNPDIVSMENVPNLMKQDIYSEFLNKLRRHGYSVDPQIVYCPDYGIPQKRRRLVLLASKLGKIKLIPKTHAKESYVTTFDVIGNLEKLSAGEVSKKDPLHRASRLKDLNLRRIKQSLPNGTWRDWDDELILDCHKKESGKSYPSVYGRMGWETPSPTITTQFYNFGTGRFGHPEQDRALSLREGALLQTFPKKYKFVKSNDDISITSVARYIGNAVPVKLGEVIGQSIIAHIKAYESE